MFLIPSPLHSYFERNTKCLLFTIFINIHAVTLQNKFDKRWIMVYANKQSRTYYCYNIKRSLESLYGFKKSQIFVNSQLSCTVHGIENKFKIEFVVW